MAMQFMTGGEVGDLLDWNVVAGSVSASTAQKRTGAYSYALVGGTSNYIRKSLTAKAEFYIQVAFYFATASNATTYLLKWKSGTTVLGTLVYDAVAKVLKLYTGDSSVLRVTGSVTINTGTWYVAEIHIKIDDAAGILALRVNGVGDGSDFSGDTKPGAETTIDTLEIITPNTVSTLYVDDIIVNDVEGSVNNSWPNCLKIVYLAPSGAGATTQWTPSAGSNYACVDEVPPSGADYVSVNADAQLDTYALADLPAEANAIAAVKATVRALKSGTPAIDKIKNAVRTGGTDYLGSAQALTTAAAAYPSIWETNPNTAIAWTPADVNGLEAGQKSAA